MKPVNGLELIPKDLQNLAYQLNKRAYCKEKKMCNVRWTGVLIELKLPSGRYLSKQNINHRNRDLHVGSRTAVPTSSLEAH